MRLLRIHSAIEEDFGPVWDIYRSSFPSDGQRSLEEQFALFNRQEYSLFALKDAVVVGLMGVWDLGRFEFIEHFAVDEEHRSAGYGRTAMLMRDGSRQSVLEVLPQSSAVRFFERCGFHPAPFEYLQPPGMRKYPIRLQLMSAPMTLDQKTFCETRNRIHKVVYGLEVPLVQYAK